jgi:hypothetical protein
MNYQKLILRKLNMLAEEKGPDAYGYLDPEQFHVQAGDERYLAAVKHLMSQQIILGATKSGRPFFRINPEKNDIVQRAIRPWYKTTQGQFFIGTLIAAGALVWSIVTFVLN